MNPLTLMRVSGESEFLLGLGAGLLALVCWLVLTRGGTGWFGWWATACVGVLVGTGHVRWYEGVSSWSVASCAAAALLAAITARRVTLTVPAPTVPLLLALTVLGVWGTVPDTEGTLILMGVTAAMLPAALVRRGNAAPGIASLLAASIVVACVIAIDGRGRAGSVPGALGAFGMLIIAPVVALFVRERRPIAPATRGALLIAAQTAFVIVSGRVAGRLEGALPAALVVAAAALLAAAGWALVLTHGSRLLALPAPDRRLVLRALPVVIATRLALRLLPFRRIVGRVERVRLRPGRRPSSDSIARAVARASRVVPGATCLTQALAAQVLLRRAGHPARLRIGVAKDGEFAAHAWVEAHTGEALIGGNGEGYAVLADFA